MLSHKKLSTLKTKTFEMTHLFFTGSTTKFTEKTAPKYLCEGGRKGSTMDNRWFWNSHILKLEVGGHVDTCFQRVKRIS